MIGFAGVALAGLVMAAAAAEPLPACAGSGVRMQVLGSGGAELYSGRAASGYLIYINGRARVLIDSGSGTLLRLHASGASATDIDVVLFTRLHAALTADFPAFVHAAARAGGTRTLAVYGPDGNRFAPSTVAFVRALMDGVRGAYRHLGDTLRPLKRDGLKLRPQDVRPARNIGRAPDAATVEVYRDRDLELAAIPITHGIYPALLWRVRAAGKTIVVGDVSSDNDRALVQLARNADLVIFPEEAAAHAGQMAAGAFARQLLVASRVPGRETETLAAVRAAYAGPVHFAEDLGCFAP